MRFREDLSGRVVELGRAVGAYSWLAGSCCTCSDRITSHVAITKVRYLIDVPENYGGG